MASRHGGSSAAGGAVAAAVQGGTVVEPRHSGPSAAVGAVAQGGVTGPRAVAAGDGTSQSSAPRKVHKYTCFNFWQYNFPLCSTVLTEKVLFERRFLCLMLLAVVKYKVVFFVL